MLGYMNVKDLTDLTSTAHPGVAAKDKRCGRLMHYVDSSSKSFNSLFSIPIFQNHVHDGDKFLSWAVA